MDTVQERVARGVALLDEKCPGWHEKINLWRLDIACGQHCVLGQIFGGYDGGLDHVGLPSGMSHGLFPRHGHISSDGSYGDTDEVRSLNREWKRVVRSRRPGRFQRLLMRLGA